MYTIDTNKFKEDLNKMMNKLDASVSESVLRKALSKSSIFLAQWSAENRLAPLNKNRKQVLADKLTARSPAGYKFRIFGQAPGDIKKTSEGYEAKFGTNVNNKGFSYPRLHEFGGIFHPARPVLSPAVQLDANRKKILDIFIEDINEALK